MTGQILIGIVLGPSVIGLLDRHTIEGLHPITHFALGLIAVQVGSHLNLSRLSGARKRLLYLILAEATITPLLVLVTLKVTNELELTDATWQLVLLLAMMAVSTAPATVLALVKETRSKGVFVKTLVAAVALNNIACIAMFEVAHAAARASFGGWR